LKKSLVFLMAFLAVGCGEAAKQVLRPMNLPRPVEAVQDAPSGFGPFLLPEDRTLSSVSVNWFTPEPSETTLYFSMAGEEDWFRSDPKETRLHRMVFPGLEEAADYRFDVKTKEPGVERLSAIRTAPYGDEYAFDFGVARVDRTIYGEIPPHFLVLMSGESHLSQGSFAAFCRSNARAVSGTVILPMFDFDVDGTVYSLSKNGLAVFRYRDANLVLVYKGFRDWNAVSQAFSPEPEQRNYLFVASDAPEDIRNAALTAASAKAKVFTLAGKAANGVCPVDETVREHFVKNRSFTLGMER